MPPSTQERKGSGSYYTPRTLVERLLDTSLQPLIDERAKAHNPEQALLSLTVCDPACGAGVFLAAACDRIAEHLAAVRLGERDDEEALACARRDVVQHCLYGVDLNPSAVDLTKVVLQTLALREGSPNPFLDHRIKHGNALVGTFPKLLQQGIPDAAFTPVEGDDPAVARELQKRNRSERRANAQEQEELF